MIKNPDKTLGAAGTGNIGTDMADSSAAASAEIERLGSAKKKVKRVRPAAKASETVSEPSKAKRKANAIISGNLIPLKRVCQTLQIDPKRARVILRKKLRDGGTGLRHEIGEGRWELTEKQAAKVKEVLKEHMRANA